MPEGDIHYDPLPSDDPDLQRLERQTLDALRASGTNVVAGSANLPPLSKRLLEMAHPLLDNAHGDRAVQRHVLGLAVAAWNASLKPRGSRGDDFDSAFRSLGARGLVRVLSGAALELMISYKESFFPDDPRRILDFEIREDAGGVGINVVAGLAPQDGEGRGM